MSANIFIGTSGFSYDHWNGAYYPTGLPQRDLLAFYSRDFTTVEINATFYRLQNVATFKRWREETPPAFRFAVKGSRYVTHLIRLKDARDAVMRFYAPAAELGDKLSVTLWQTPPDLSKDLSLLDGFLNVLNEETPPGVRQAFEFRSEDWLTRETYSLLDERGCGLVIADSDRYPTAENIVCGGFAYLRFHGRAKNGYDYREGDLKLWAAKIRRWTAESLDVYAYFNNDARAYAVKNAKYLKSIIGK